jgi:hypothetical protein
MFASVDDVSIMYLVQVLIQNRAYVRDCNVKMMGGKNVNVDVDMREEAKNAVGMLAYKIWTSNVLTKKGQGLQHASNGGTLDIQRVGKRTFKVCIL